MYKRQSWIAVVLAAVTVIAGCGSQQTQTTANSGSQTTTASTDSKGPIEVDFWYSLGGKNGEVIETLVKQFNSEQNEVKIKAAYQGDYYENHAKVMSAIAAGNQPDLTMVEIGSIAAFAENGALEPLESYVNGSDGVELNDYIPGLMGNSYWKDTLYAIPFNRSTPLLYINRDMLKQADLPIEGPKTWDELRTFSKASSGGEGEKQTWGFSTPIDIWFYEALVFENGGNILSEDGKTVMFNQPKGIEPIRFWKEMIDEGIMKMPPGEKYNAWDVAKSDFINQKVAMIFTSTGDLNGLLEQAKFDVGTAFLPAKESYGVPTGGANLVVLAKSSAEEKAAAWKFIKWLTSPENTATFSKNTGYMPVRQSALSSEEMKKLYAEKPQFQVAVNQLEYAKPRPKAPGYKELQEIIMTEIQRAILGQASPEEALETAAEKAQKLLK
ncbi:ABC transporter substrate-binding protein [Brevibacillus humidisoli]|uniref:ABC transporter substrate-binding protein n=1 Tax=Brevibacillus humidisoli TaxID=2895522 RepID=UPI001E4EE250|nr:ABC transporter substrate-binding protein [Brevibacillus humidisoli]UFJ42711.1 ABC transporter substrate-binding protein [Brevibacillus humidisoli]